MEKIDQTAEFLLSKIQEVPTVGMITGTGLGNVIGNMDARFRIPYEEIPHFPRSTVEGHSGYLISGVLSGKQVIAMEGRFHLYEGYTPKEITFPVRVMARLGARSLLISSAAGGLNPLFEDGDLMMVTDHINLTGTNPLVGQNQDEFGPRFPKMVEPYPRELIHMARQKALRMGISLRLGVYAGVLGPSMETPAETRALRTLGADAVGMSTVSETIVAVHSGLKVMAATVITNMNLPDCMEGASVEQIVETARNASHSLADLWEAIIQDLPD